MLFVIGSRFQCTTSGFDQPRVILCKRKQSHQWWMHLNSLSLASKANGSNNESDTHMSNSHSLQNWEFVLIFQRIIGDAPPTCRSYHLLRSLSCGAFSLLPGFRSTIVTEGPQDVVLLGPLTVKFFKKSSSIGRHSCGDLWPAPQADHTARLKPMCTFRGCCF